MLDKEVLYQLRKQVTQVEEADSLSAVTRALQGLVRLACALLGVPSPVPEEAADAGSGAGIGLEFGLPCDLPKSDALSSVPDAGEQTSAPAEAAPPDLTAPCEITLGNLAAICLTHDEVTFDEDVPVCTAHRCAARECLEAGRIDEWAIGVALSKQSKELDQRMRGKKKEIFLKPGEKIDVRTLPRGTVVHYPPRQEAKDPLDDVRSGKAAPASPFEAALVRRPGDPEVGPAIARKWAGFHEVVRPAFDPSTLPESERELFSDYRPGTERRTFDRPEDTFKYEAEVGGGEVEVDGETIQASAADIRAAYDDEFPDELPDSEEETFNAVRPTRTAGKATVRTRGSKPV